MIATIATTRWRSWPERRQNEGGIHSEELLLVSSRVWVSPFICIGTHVLIQIGGGTMDFRVDEIASFFAVFVFRPFSPQL